MGRKGLGSLSESSLKYTSGELMEETEPSSGTAAQFSCSTSWMSLCQRGQPDAVGRGGRNMFGDSPFNQLQEESSPVAQ